MAALHIGQALRQRSYLNSVWPLRAVAYLATTVPVAGVLSLGLLVFVAPLIAVLNALANGLPIELPIVVFLTWLALVIVAVAPVVGGAVATVERWRLRLVDPRPVAAHRFGGIAERYTTAAGWREVAFAFWLGGIVPVAYWTLLLLATLDALVIVAPWLAAPNDEVVVIFTIVDTPGEAVPYTIGGVLFIPVLAYLVGLLASAQAAVARRLLGGTADGAALREVTRSRTRLVTAYEAERRRIERDVHDGAQSRLASLTLQLGMARLDVPDDSAAARPLAVAHEQAKSLMVVLREIVSGIRPQVLTELGLAGAVRELAGEAPVRVTVRASLPDGVPELVETTAYYVVAEALGNVARHAAATRADVRLTADGGTLVVEVEDDGRGGADPELGTGLTGLADRVAAAGGRLLLASPDGGPTVVRVELPCLPG